jgi:hypothetical protein
MANYRVALTTVDNPYDPFEQFEQWLLFDAEKGYQTLSYLGRIAHICEDMTQKEEDEEVERAIDEIIRYDFLNIYKKVKQPYDSIAAHISHEPPESIGEGV